MIPTTIPKKIHLHRLLSYFKVICINKAFSHLRLRQRSVLTIAMNLIAGHNPRTHPKISQFIHTYTCTYTPFAYRWEPFLGATFKPDVSCQKLTRHFWQSLHLLGPGPVSRSGVCRIPEIRIRLADDTDKRDTQKSVMEAPTDYSVPAIYAQCHPLSDVVVYMVVGGRRGFRVAGL